MYRTGDDLNRLSYLDSFEPVIQDIRRVRAKRGVAEEEPVSFIYNVTMCHGVDQVKYRKRKANKYEESS